MRFIEDCHIVRREQRSSTGKIQEKERVIHNHDVGSFRFLAFSKKEAIGKMRTMFANAVVGIGIEFFPVVTARH